ncbi:type IX secretion system membrane protein PorP/SprF [Cytophagaceae bacterium YF14B1]|uniref:Type IX secretion system membrane protein PorP/SprF n=1 Tax=Xanthocytophaga flava TaxID=3048013 RepID=A0AAE3UA77_9BACT|nr:type IX secretion system membrane protein PorP/SprF [Xanthocytophaga flavus]MDJ1483018.1 type IX secretion system membrane protein PorP/SprF [Xanthocytophaga flavus]
MRKLLSIILIVFCNLVAWAQDPQFSQFYANPLYLNPALAGGAHATRLTANYRHQWPSLDANYLTYSAGIDTYLPRINSGIGLIIMRDQQAFARYNSIDIGAQYAYELQVSDLIAVRAGLQFSYVNRSINYFGLTFGDQFDGKGGFTLPSNDDLANKNPAALNYLNVSAGGMVYTSRAWLGFSASNLTRPNQAYTEVNSPLPVRFTVHGGFKIPLDDNTKHGLAEDKTAPERSISPVFLYKAQGKYDQFDVGMYLTYEPVVFGLWYRGLPIKRYEVGINNNDAMVFLVGFKQSGLSIGYSYDLTISNLGTATGGSHELSLSYEFPPAAPKKHVKRRVKRLPCPKF